MLYMCSGEEWKGFECWNIFSQNITKLTRKAKI